MRATLTRTTEVAVADVILHGAGSRYIVACKRFHNGEDVLTQACANTGTIVRCTRSCLQGQQGVAYEYTCAISGSNKSLARTSCEEPFYDRGILWDGLFVDTCMLNDNAFWLQMIAPAIRAGTSVVLLTTPRYGILLNRANVARVRRLAPLGVGSIPMWHRSCP